jgi:hypothetical protein
MNKKCIYCKKEIPGDAVIDFCETCGKGVWGEKMFNAIVRNMEEAKDKGDLCSTNMIEPSFDARDIRIL